MSRPFTVELESTNAMTTQQELRVVRAAFERKPSATLRGRLAALLTFNDESQAVTEVLEGRLDLSAREEILLGQAWLALETPAGDTNAYQAASRALSLSQEPEARANALALRAKAETRLGNMAAARQTLADALTLDPHNKDACKRAAAISLAEQDGDAVLSLHADLAGRGAAHSRLFAAQALAYAQRGETDAARDIIGSDLFFSAEKLPPPHGWSSIEAFNAALADELIAHPELRFDRYGAASESSWRIDTMPSPAAPLARVLIESISEAIRDHVRRCVDSSHPWAAARPDSALLRSWCVIAESEGFENWHVHQFGWLSGAYYVRVPEAIAHGTTREGCIAFGLPEDLVGEPGAAAFGTRVIRPESGLLLLFPSHTYHRTFPHGHRDRRICVAFDVKPLPGGPLALPEVPKVQSSIDSEPQAAG